MRRFTVWRCRGGLLLRSKSALHQARILVSFGLHAAMEAVLPDYRRCRIPGGCYFFTVNLLNRRCRFLVEHIDVLREAASTVRGRYPFYIDAWVVLPDHMHCIWTLPSGDEAYGLRWRLIKTLFAKAITASESRSRVRQIRGERGVWQRRFWEHTIRSDHDYANHFNYIHFNPVKHGYVENVGDWPYSTFHWYVAKGVLAPDVDLDVGDLETVAE